MQSWERKDHGSMMLYVKVDNTMLRLNNLKSKDIYWLPYMSAVQ